MSLLRNVEYDLRRFRARVLVASMFVLFIFSLLFLRLVYLQLWRYQEFIAHGHRAYRAQPGRHHGPQWRGLGHQLLGLHAGDHAIQSH